MGIFSFPPYFGQSPTVLSEKTQGHRCGICSLACGVLKFKVVSSDIAFKSILLYSNICSKVADSAHYPQLRSGQGAAWGNLSMTQTDHIHIRKYVLFFFSWALPGLDSRQSCVHSSPILGLSDFWPGACPSRCFPRTGSWNPCCVDWTRICQGSPWGWLEICRQQHFRAHGLHHCRSLRNSGIQLLQG